MVAIQVPGIIIAPNGELVPMYAGQVVCLCAGRALFARASSARHAQSLGIVIGGVSPTTIFGAAPTLGVRVRTVGEVELPVAQWQAGAGLIPDADYFLSVDPGCLVTAPPVGAGNYVVRVGRALSPTVLALASPVPILL
jgi:hypothetical protein